MIKKTLNGRKKGEIYVVNNFKLPIITIICGFLILFFEFCTINIMGGELIFMFQFPLHFSGSFFDLCESLVVVSIPVLLLLLTFFYVKKNVKLLCWPLLLFIVRILVQIGYLWIYEGYFSLEETWLNLLIYLVMLLVFELTIYGILPNKWWFSGCCGIFLLWEIAKLFIPAASYSFVVGTSIYLSTFLSYSLFFIGYGMLGLALEKRQR